MFIAIVGGGNVGAFLAARLQEAGHRIIVLEKSEAVTKDLAGKAPNYTVAWADGCEPDNLEEAGVRQADVIAAVTGDDEDNLVIAQLAKYEFGVPRVVARINDPKNQWLFSKKWGVDVPVSAPHLMLQLIEEELSLGDLVTLLKLKHGQVSLSELTITEHSPVAGKTLGDITLPANCIMVAVMRDSEVIIPKGDTRLEKGDEVLCILPSREEAELSKFLSG